jgi:hypothetical protein
MQMVRIEAHIPYVEIRLLVMLRIIKELNPPGIYFVKLILKQ